MMVWLHLNFQKDHLCHQLFLQRTSLEDELKYFMSAKSDTSTVIQSKVMRVAHLNSFQTRKISLTRMVAWIIQTTVKTIAADVRSNKEHDIGIEDLECPEQRDVNAAPNVPGLIQRTQKSKRQAEIVLVNVKAMEMRRKNGIKTK